MAQSGWLEIETRIGARRLGPWRVPAEVGALQGRLEVLEGEHLVRSEQRGGALEVVERSAGVSGAAVRESLDCLFGDFTAETGAAILIFPSARAR